MTVSPRMVFSARRIVTPQGIVAGRVHVRGGRIAAVTADFGADGAGGAGGADGTGDTWTLADDEVLLPGLVDTHVHVNEPGRTDWEGFATATAAAAAGGVTTIIDMPLNSIPPTIDVAALEAKRQAADGQCAVNVGFWGGAVPGNLAAMPALHAAGVFGFKCFLVDSGVPEFPPLDDSALDKAMRQVAELRSLLVVHAEDAASIGAPESADYAGFLRSRPPAAEVVAVARVIGLARSTGARVHILHVSAADAVPLLAAAQAEGLPVTAETCPHFLTFAAEDIRPGQTQFKCCPPIREAANRERLWDGLAAGVIGCVISDHSPCPPGLKAGDFASAWGGISSLQLGLPVMWTQARSRGFGLAEVARWMAASPASVAGLATKGTIAPGMDADLVVFAPDETFTVTKDQLLTKHKLTPYEGVELRGVVRRIWCGASLLYR